MKKQEFLEGIRDGIPICLGYFSVSMAFGLTAVLSGVPIWAAVVISLIVLSLNLFGDGLRDAFDPKLNG